MMIIELVAEGPSKKRCPVPADPPRRFDIRLSPSVYFAS